MTVNFNGLAPAETERLALLLEELGEAQQAIGKILRHGYESQATRKSRKRQTGKIWPRKSATLRALFFDWKQPVTWTTTWWQPTGSQRRSKQDDTFTIKTTEGFKGKGVIPLSIIESEFKNLIRAIRRSADGIDQKLDKMQVLLDAEEDVVVAEAKK
jgi:hypothetical protein